MGRGFLCAAIGCKNYRSTSGLSFHLFPKERERCLEWLSRCGRNDLLETFEQITSTDATYFCRNFALCSLHFDSSCYHRKSGVGTRSRLHKDSLPTIFTATVPSTAASGPRSPHREETRKLKLKRMRDAAEEKVTIIVEVDESTSTASFSPSNTEHNICEPLDDNIKLSSTPSSSLPGNHTFSSPEPASIIKTDEYLRGSINTTSNSVTSKATNSTNLSCSTTTCVGNSSKIGNTCGGGSSGRRKLLRPAKLGTRRTPAFSALKLSSSPIKSSTSAVKSRNIPTNSSSSATNSCISTTKLSTNTTNSSSSPNKSSISLNKLKISSAKSSSSPTKSVSIHSNNSKVTHAPNISPAWGIIQYPSSNLPTCAAQLSSSLIENSVQQPKSDVHYAVDDSVDSTTINLSSGGGCPPTCIILSVLDRQDGLGDGDANTASTQEQNAISRQSDITVSSQPANPTSCVELNSTGASKCASHSTFAGAVQTMPVLTFSRSKDFPVIINLGDSKSIGLKLVNSSEPGNESSHCTALDATSNSCASIFSNRKFRFSESSLKTFSSKHTSLQPPPSTARVVAPPASAVQTIASSVSTDDAPTASGVAANEEAQSLGSLAMYHALSSSNITAEFCRQHGISARSGQRCRRLMELWEMRKRGRSLQQERQGPQQQRRRNLLERREECHSDGQEKEEKENVHFVNSPVKKIDHKNRYRSCRPGITVAEQSVSTCSDRQDSAPSAAAVQQARRQLAEIAAATTARGRQRARPAVSEREADRRMQAWLRASRARDVDRNLTIEEMIARKDSLDEQIESLQQESSLLSAEFRRRYSQRFVLRSNIKQARQRRQLSADKLEKCALFYCKERLPGSTYKFFENQRLNLKAPRWDFESLQVPVIANRCGLYVRETLHQILRMPSICTLTNFRNRLRKDLNAAPDGNLFKNDFLKMYHRKLFRRRSENPPLGHKSVASILRDYIARREVCGDKEAPPVLLRRVQRTQC